MLQVANSVDHLFSWAVFAVKATVFLPLFLASTPLLLPISTLWFGYKMVTSILRRISGIFNTRKSINDADELSSEKVELSTIAEAATYKEDETEKVQLDFRLASVKYSKPSQTDLLEKSAVSYEDELGLDNVLNSVLEVSRGAPSPSYSEQLSVISEEDEELPMNVSAAHLSNESFRKYTTLCYYSDDDLPPSDIENPSTSQTSSLSWERDYQIDLPNIDKTDLADSQSVSLSDILQDSDEDDKENQNLESSKSKNHTNAPTNRAGPFSTKSTNAENWPVESKQSSYAETIRPFGELSNFAARATQRVHSPLTTQAERKRTLENVRSIKMDIQSIMEKIDRAVTNLDE